MKYLYKIRWISLVIIVIGLIALFVTLFTRNQFSKRDQISNLSFKRQVQDLQTQINVLSEKAHVGIIEEYPAHVRNGGFRINLDFLYWQANEDGLEYGTKMIAGPIIGQSSKTKTKLLDLHFDWDPGFRVGIGYVFNHFDQWALDLNWTHIRNEAHAKDSAHGVESQVGEVDTIIPPWVSLLFELRSGASKAHAHWHVNFNTVDLDLTRSYFASKRLDVNPHIGLRGAWIDQHYRAKYESVFLLSEGSPFFTRDVKFTGKNDFWGVGIRGGSELMWHFDRHWNLFAELSASILYGRFHVKMKNLHDQGLGEGDTTPMPLDFKASEHLWRTRLNFEEAIGFSWGTFFNQDKYHVSIRAAYELSQWLNQNELFYAFYLRGQDTISSVPIRNQGNLGFQGIKAGIQFDF